MPGPASYKPLPARAQDFPHGDWEALRPFFDELIAAELDEASLGPWLGQWSGLFAHFLEADGRLYSASACDAADKAKEAAFLHFQQVIGPKSEEAWQALRKKLLQSGLKPSGMEQPLRRMQAWAAIYREENLPLTAELVGLENDFNQIRSAWSVDVDGKTLTRADVVRLLEDPDRALRERVWRATMQRNMAESAALDELFGKLVEGRHRLGVNAGLAGYTPYRFLDLGRLDISVEDCQAFHTAILEHAVPLAVKLEKLYARELGLTQLRPWDAGVNVFGDLPAIGVERMQAGVKAMLEKVCPATVRHFRRLEELGTLDLADRPGKRYAGFCAALPLSQGAFIFMNANGTDNDVATLAHEAGHAMHFMESIEALPLGFQWFANSECNETAATCVEYMVLEHLQPLYTPQQAARVRLGKLSNVAAGFAYVAVIDAFQHWAYANPAASSAQRNAFALELMQRYFPAMDWSGFEREHATFWQRTEHIFNTPLYYLEYGIAQLGALQLWRKSLSDPAGASAVLAEAMRLGGTVTSADFFKAAGMELRMDGEMLKGLMEELEASIEECLKALGIKPLP